MYLLLIKYFYETSSEPAYFIFINSRIALSKPYSYAIE